LLELEVPVAETTKRASRTLNPMYARKRGLDAAAAALSRH